MEALIDELRLLEGVRIDAGLDVIVGLLIGIVVRWLSVGIHAE